MLSSYNFFSKNCFSLEENNPIRAKSIHKQLLTYFSHKFLNILWKITIFVYIINLKEI